MSAKAGDIDLDNLSDYARFVTWDIKLLIDDKRANRAILVSSVSYVLLIGFFTGIYTYSSGGLSVIGTAPGKYWGAVTIFAWISGAGICSLENDYISQFDHIYKGDSIESFSQSITYVPMATLGVFIGYSVCMYLAELLIPVLQSIPGIYSAPFTLILIILNIYLFKYNVAFTQGDVDFEEGDVDFEEGDVDPEDVFDIKERRLRYFLTKQNGIDELIEELNNIENRISNNSITPLSDDSTAVLLSLNQYREKEDENFRLVRVEEAESKAKDVLPSLANKSIENAHSNFESQDYTEAAEDFGVAEKAFGHIQRFGHDETNRERAAGTLQELCSHSADAAGDNKDDTKWSEEPSFGGLTPADVQSSIEELELDPNPYQQIISHQRQNRTERLIEAADQVLVDALGGNRALSGDQSAEDLQEAKENLEAAKSLLDDTTTGTTSLESHAAFVTSFITVIEAIERGDSHIERGEFDAAETSFTNAAEAAAAYQDQRPTEYNIDAAIDVIQSYARERARAAGEFVDLSDQAKSITSNYQQAIIEEHLESAHDFAEELITEAAVVLDTVKESGINDSVVTEPILQLLRPLSIQPQAEAEARVAQQAYNDAARYHELAAAVLRTEPEIWRASGNSYEAALSYVSEWEQVITELEAAEDSIGEEEYARAIEQLRDAGSHIDESVQIADSTWLAPSSAEAVREYIHERTEFAELRRLTSLVIDAKALFESGEFEVAAQTAETSIDFAADVDPAANLEQDFAVSVADAERIRLKSEFELAKQERDTGVERFEAEEYEAAQDIFALLQDRFESIGESAIERDMEDLAEQAAEYAGLCDEHTATARRARLGIDQQASLTEAKQAVSAPESTEVETGSQVSGRRPGNVSSGRSGGNGADGPHLGRGLPNHEVLSHLGSGGNADVNKVELEDGTIAALKVPHMGGTVSKQVVEMFIKEAGTWERLDEHPNIIGVIDWGTAPYPWILLEFMQGGNLEDQVHAITSEERPELLISICEAVKYAHGKGIAHTDLKPANVLFDGDGQVRVGDWGLAQVLLDHSVGIEGMTPRYAAPEQLDTEQYGQAGRATDIYQIGLIAYELFTGQQPFEGTGNAAILNAVLNEDLAPPSTVADCPAAVDQIVMKATARDPAERYEDILYLRDDLADLFSRD